LTVLLDDNLGSIVRSAVNLESTFKDEPILRRSGKSEQYKPDHHHATDKNTNPECYFCGRFNDWLEYDNFGSNIAIRSDLKNKPNE